MTQELYELPDGWEWKQLSQIFEIARGGSPRPIKSFITDDKNGINWIKIGDVATGKKYITQTSEKIKPEGVSKSRMVYPGDFILSNSMSFGRPYIMQIEGCIHDGWLLLRPLDKSVSVDFMYQLLSSPYMYDQFKFAASGTTVKNLNSDIVRQTNAPIPPLDEQQRLVKKLDTLLSRIDTAIEHLEHSLELNDQLFASGLNQALNPLGRKIQPDGTYQLPEGWKWKMLNDIAEVARGKSKHRPRNDKALFNGDYPFIQTGDVRNAVKYIENYSETYNERGLAQSKLWPAGTICLTIAANIGDVAILKFDACFPDSVVGITPNDMSVDFIYHFLSTIQQQLDSKANSAAQKNINLKILSEIEVPVPSRHKQEEIVKRIDELQLKTQENKQVLQQKLEQLQQLRASLLDSAFRGEL